MCNADAPMWLVQHGANRLVRSGDAAPVTAPARSFGRARVIRPGQESPMPLQRHGVSRRLDV